MTQFFNKFPTIEHYNSKTLRNLMLKAKVVRDVFNNYDNFYPYVLEEWERPDTVAADYYGDSKYYWIVLMSNDIIDPFFEWPLAYYDFMKYLEKKYNSTVDETKKNILYYEYKGIGGNIDDYSDRKTWMLPVETYNFLNRELQGTLDIDPTKIYSVTNTITQEVIHYQSVTGSNTMFEEELTNNGEIYINTGNGLEVTSVYEIRSNTEMVIQPPVGQSNTAAKYKMYYQPLGIDSRYSPEGWFPVYAYDYEVEKNDKMRSIRLLDRRYVDQVERELNVILSREL